ncbi:platelet-derived growth factor receptor-like protein [Tachysurus fulvidraco]|uniref:platelet-derived growth factor receptor-like protein n=1 Tax=Tachysurus fulvidraco TaxID=1234273 RepID=UPI001FEF31A5|nr:platelet-derived growth factor receptor-like protein [Tachysurus fulvidraco]
MKLLVVFPVLLFSLLLLQLVMSQKEPKPAGDKKLKEKVKVKTEAEKKNKNTSVKTKATPSAKPPSPTAPPPYLTRVVGKGKFEKVGKMLSVPAGDTLELRCKGSRVQWDVPSYLQEDDEGRLRTLQHERYGALILVNSSGADTGAYICYPLYCVDSDCRKEYDKALNVFIFFPDPQELFVPSSDYYEVIQLRSNRPTVLPCQVTTPQAKVTLHREFPPVEVKVDGSEISYDVTRGFTIYRPKAHHAGSLYCVASVGNLRQSSIKYMLIYVHYPAAPPVPVLQTSSSSVFVGVNLQLSCIVVGEQDVAVDFTWEYPGQKIGRPLYTQETTQAVQVDGLSRQRSQSVLQVDEVREVDKGTYTCTAQNLQGSRSVSTNVNVQKKDNSKKPHTT